MKDAAYFAVEAVGRASIPHLTPISLEGDSEISPSNERQALIASLSARVAEFAAKTARSKPSQSSEFVTEAYGSALDVIHEVGREDLYGSLEMKFMQLLTTTNKKPSLKFIDI